MTTSERNTYFGRAEVDGDMAAGGRYAKVEASRVTGVPVYPALPPSSPWHHDPVPREEPLGQDVDATMIPVGTAPEIERSICARALSGPLSEAPTSVSSAGAVETERGPLNPSIIRRR